MTSDEKDQFYKAGYLAGKEHSKPSPITKKFMDTINMEIQYIKEKLDKIPTRDEMILANRNLVEEVLKSVKENYVSKDEFSPIKNIVWGTTGAIGLAIVTAVITLVIK